MLLFSFAALIFCADSIEKDSESTESLFSIDYSTEISSESAESDDSSETTDISLDSDFESDTTTDLISESSEQEETNHVLEDADSSNQSSDDENQDTNSNSSDETDEESNTPSLSTENNDETTNSEVSESLSISDTFDNEETSENSINEIEKTTDYEVETESPTEVETESPTEVETESPTEVETSEFVMSPTQTPAATGTPTKPPLPDYDEPLVKEPDEVKYGYMNVSIPKGSSVVMNVSNLIYNETNYYGTIENESIKTIKLEGNGNPNFYINSTTNITLTFLRTPAQYGFSTTSDIYPRILLSQVDNKFSLKGSGEPEIGINEDQLTYALDHLLIRNIQVSSNHSLNLLVDERLNNKIYVEQLNLYQNAIMKSSVKNTGRPNTVRFEKVNLYRNANVELKNAKITTTLNISIGAKVNLDNVDVSNAEIYIEYNESRTINSTTAFIAMRSISLKEPPSKIYIMPGPDFVPKQTKTVLLDKLFYNTKLHNEKTNKKKVLANTFKLEIAAAEAFPKCEEWKKNIVFLNGSDKKFNKISCEKTVNYILLSAAYEEESKPNIVDENQILSSGAIAGIIISVVLVLALSVVFGVYCFVIKTRPIYTSDFSEKENDGGLENSIHPDPISI